MRKVLAFLLVTALLILCLYAYATAEAEEAYDVVYTVDTLQYDGTTPILAGTTFDIRVSINAVPSISMCELHLRYNKQVISPVSSSTGGFLSLLPFQDCNIAPFVNADNTTTVYGEIWITGMDSNQYATADGEVIATITFQALQDITNSSPVFCAQTPLAAVENNGIKQLTASCVDGGLYFETPLTTPRETSPTDTVLSTTTLPESTTMPTVVYTPGSQPIVYGPGGAVVTLVPDTTHATMATTAPPIANAAAQSYRGNTSYIWIVLIGVLAALSVAGAIVLPRHKDAVRRLWQRVISALKTAVQFVKTKWPLGRKNASEDVQEDMPQDKEMQEESVPSNEKEVPCPPNDETPPKEEDSTSKVDEEPLVNEQSADGDPAGTEDIAHTE